ncbi:MAG: histidine phosphatase family protein [Acidimicrobiales bacterium]|nr:histidine phosphatase family protein [Acidimicrobiales bacterium]
MPSGAASGPSGAASGPSGAASGHGDVAAVRPGGAAASGAGGEDELGSEDRSRVRLVVVRHGATEWSQSGRHTGRTDLPLLDEGRRQARELGSRLADHDFALVLTSPLRRARQTCALAGFGPVARECDDLREWDYGDYEGRTTDEIRAKRPGWSLWRDAVPGGETARQVGDRADRVIEAVRVQDGDVLAFAHAHVLRVVAARWVGLPATDGALLTLSPATISVLGWERDVAVVERWNDAAGDALG